MIWLYKFCQPSLILLSMTNISRVRHDRIALSRPRIAKVLFKKNKVKDFPVGPTVMTPCFQCMSAGDAGLIPKQFLISLSQSCLTLCDSMEPARLLCPSLSP